MNERMFAELFGGVGRFKTIRHLFEHPNEEFSAREIAAQTKLDPGNTHRWLQRWEEVGILKRGSLSKTSYQASLDPALSPLVTLFRQSSDLVTDLRQVLAEMVGIEVAFVFGSFARHEENASSDIDVLVLGDVSKLKTSALLRPLSRKYGRPFNASVSTVDAFQESMRWSDSFATEVMQKPKIPLIGDADVIAGWPAEPTTTEQARQCFPNKART